jgi:tRNA threonylcarbamoyladenosine modification (KEOPS) complex  Pcc1 subunit
MIIEHNVVVSPENYTCSYVRSAVGLEDKFVVNIVLISIAERDSSAVEGHNSSYRKTVNRASSVDHG